MDPRAIDKARSRLRIAKRATADLRTSQTFSEFKDNWYVFLTSIRNIYTQLEEGSQASVHSQQWFDTITQIRKGDDLLQYIYEARNRDEHGLGTAVELQPERHEIGVGGPQSSSVLHFSGQGPLQNVTIAGLPSGVVAFAVEGSAPPAGMNVTPLDGKPVGFRRTPATTILIPVHDRKKKRTYSPPTTHLGKPLQDCSPIGVATCGLVYMEQLVNDAAKL